MTDAERKAADDAKAAEDAAKADDDKKKSKKKDDVEKIELTQEELDDKINKAVAKANKKHESEKADADEKAKAEAAKKAGDFEKLYTSEVEGRKAAEAAAKVKDLELKRRDVQLKLRDHLADASKDYLSSAKYIMPMIDFDADTSDEEVEKRVKAAATQFVKDNPRKTAGGAPGAAGGGQPSDGDDKKKKETIPSPPYMRRL